MREVASVQEEIERHKENEADLVTGDVPADPTSSTVEQRIRILEDEKVLLETRHHDLQKDMRHVSAQLTKQLRAKVPLSQLWHEERRRAGSPLQLFVT